MVELGWIFVSFVLGLIDVCVSYEGSDEFTWPGSTWDGLAVGYGHPGWELPLAEFPAPLAGLPAPLENIVHNHYHHIVGGGGGVGGGGPGLFGGPGGLAPHEELIDGPLYQHFPTGHHHHGGHHHATRDWYCHHAKKVKHLKKWFMKMLFCNLVY